MRPLTARCGCQNEKSGGANWVQDSAGGFQRGDARRASCGCGWSSAGRGAPGLGTGDAITDASRRTIGRERSEVSDSPHEGCSLCVNTCICRKRPGRNRRPAVLRGRPLGRFLPLMSTELARARTRDGRTLGGRPEAPTVVVNVHAARSGQRMLERTKQTNHQVSVAAGIRDYGNPI